MNGNNKLEQNPPTIAGHVSTAFFAISGRLTAQKNYAGIFYAPSFVEKLPNKKYRHSYLCLHSQKSRSINRSSSQNAHNNIHHYAYAVLSSCSRASCTGCIRYLRQNVHSNNVRYACAFSSFHNPAPYTGCTLCSYVNVRNNTSRCAYAFLFFHSLTLYTVCISFSRNVHNNISHYADAPLLSCILTPCIVCTSHSSRNGRYSCFSHAGARPPHYSPIPCMTYATCPTRNDLLHDGLRVHAPQR